MSTSLADLKNNGNAVAKKPKTIFDFLTDDKVKTAIGAVAGKIMTPDRFLRLAINAIKRTPRLMECDPQTVLGAFMTSAALGLEPNTVLQQAFLIPYKKKTKRGNDWIETYECQFQIGYRGFVTLAHRSPHVLTIEAEAIHEGDHFKHMKGSRSFLEYEKALKGRGELIGAFAFSKLEDNAEAATILTLDELHKIRDRSETYQSLLRGIEKQGMSDWEAKKAAGKLNDTPWVLWEDDMAAKSAIKKHAKQLPLNPGDAMTAAVALDAERDDGRTIDMAEMADVDKLRSVIQDGEVPPDDAPAAIEQQEGNFMDMPTTSQRESEPIVVRGFEEQPTQAARNVEPPVDAEKNKLINAMRDAKDQDTLDAHADLISNLPASDQAEATKVYRECTRALASGDAPRGTGRQMAMSIE
jgi:recombination protein RecT